MMTALNTWNPIFKDLSARRAKVTSENLTDGIIEAVFEICPPANKWCVEVGAFNGYDCSNTWPLIKKGWRSLQIDARSGCVLSLKERYKDNPNVYITEAAIRPDNYAFETDFSKILSLSPVPDDFDFLSLDIDGQEYEVWRAMAHYKPNLILVECNSVEENFDVVNYDPSYSVKEGRLEGYNPSRYGGATVGLLNKLAEFKGYDLICVENHDALYIKKDFAKNLYL